MATTTAANWKGPGVVISTVLPPTEAEVVRARAEEADRTVAAELRRALRAYLASEDHPTPASGEGGRDPA